MKLYSAMWFGIILAWIGFLRPMGFNAVGSYVYQLSYPSGFITVVLIIIAVVCIIQDNQKLLIITLTTASLCMFYPVFDILQHPLYIRNINGESVCRILWLNWIPIIAADVCFTIQTFSALARIRAKNG